jgi:hypothetical protein
LIERQLLTSDTVEKETPHCDKEEDETDGVLEEKLGTNCPIKKTSIRRMTKPTNPFVSRLIE